MAVLAVSRIHGRLSISLTLSRGVCFRYIVGKSRHRAHTHTHRITAGGKRRVAMFVCRMLTKGAIVACLGRQAREQRPRPRARCCPPLCARDRRTSERRGSFRKDGHTGMGLFSICSCNAAGDVANKVCARAALATHASLTPRGRAPSDRCDAAGPVSSDLLSSPSRPRGKTTSSSPPSTTRPPTTASPSAAAVSGTARSSARHCTPSSRPMVATTCTASSAG